MDVFGSVHDGYPGRAGFTARGFTAFETWIRATRDAVTDCRCETCRPSCVQSPETIRWTNPGRSPCSTSSSGSFPRAHRIHRIVRSAPCAVHSGTYALAETPGSASPGKDRHHLVTAVS
ncbi:Zn-binding domain-containing protein [Williamsia phyllosphaerae]|uniref:Zn-binding domain-containing protein n=1 Tax=Williamsia phyllosphaerae TaxID=885042 RepID=UPI00353067A7